MRKHRLLSFVALAAAVWAGSPGARGQSPATQLVGEGAIVAFHKQTRHRVKPYQRGTGTYVEVWIVRIDSWSTGNKGKGYFLVEYNNVSERALSDREISRPRWQFVFREPQAQESKACEPMTLVGSEAPLALRPALLDDFERTKPGRTDAIPPLNELPCLIADKPPTVVKAQHEHGPKVDAATVDQDGSVHLSIPVVATSKPKR